jgi:signal transduction histidine kinase
MLAGELDLAPPPPGLSDQAFLGAANRCKGRVAAVRLPSGSLFAVVQSSEASAALRRLLPPLVAAIVAAALGVGLVATYLFAHLTAKRLAETQAAADAIAAGDLTRRIATDRLDGVFAAQAQSLNQMLDRMEDMVNAQRQFASHLAHDLRTPLTRLRGLLAGEDAGSARLLDRAERECRSIIAIFDALLRLSEIEAGRHPTALAPLALGPVIEDVAETMEPVIADAGSRLELGELASAEIRADTGLVQQLLVNLLENVALHTPSDTRATIALAREGGEAVITIADNGPGIAAPTATAWCALSNARRPARPGSGLGLAIAQAIMRFHHGDRWNWRTIAPVWPCGCAFRCPPEGAAQHSKFAM